ncbi:MAG: diaminopimelate epimerase, partial [Acutalibacteraceae bacterium]|nr:diaminopimelate epimerase [Acutalibacteraceae bacterium]
MEVTYSLFDPTGNITLLVETPISAAERVAVASKLMELEPKAEQVGFVSQDDADVDIRLDMAGGEFCGNATMSAAALAVMR